MPRRLAFFGTPDVAVPALEALLASPGFEVVAVVTNPDRARGRSRAPVAPPVKQRALAAGLEVLQPIRPIEIADQLVALRLDAVAIVAYGAILPPEVLVAGGRGFVNLHFSLLPRWRGAAPVQAAILAGDAVTGVTCFVLDEGMDTGPILRQVATDIRDDDTTGTLLGRLAELGAPVLVDALESLLSGEVPTPQPENGATIAGKVRPDDVAIDFSRPAIEVQRLVRSAAPTPGAHTTFRGRRVKVLQVSTMPSPGDAPAGEVVGRADGCVVVATGDGALVLEQVQPEGRASMPGASFANGQRPEPGERFGA